MKLIKKDRNESGQSLVEFALILPILIFLVMGIIDFGWVFMAKITTNNAARETARLYAVSKDQAAAESAGMAAIGLLSGSKHVNVSAVEKTDNPGEYEAHAIVTGDIQPLIGFWVSNPFSVKSESYMRIEYKYP